jgi:ferredoxin
MIVLGFRIARGALRGIEEGTLYTTYPSMGYAALNQIYGPMVLWNLTSFLEDRGYETVPMLNANGGEAINPVTGKFRKDWSVPVESDKPYPDVLVHFRLAAYMAGLGDIGWSKIFLTPEFGPRVRFALCLTEADLEPDPIFEGKICDGCKLCVKNCPVNAISKTESVKIVIDGHEIEWGKIDPLACEKGIQGGYKKELNPFIGEYPRRYGYGRAIGGAYGCMRACMEHLEKKGVLKNKFKSPFRKKRPWKKIDHTVSHPLTDDVVENYEKTGMIEGAFEYENYSKKDNYGTEKRDEKLNPLID